VRLQYSTRAPLCPGCQWFARTMLAMRCSSSRAARRSSRSALAAVVLKEGDFFGEMALPEHRRHKHDVVAKTRCRLYVLASGSLERLGRCHPERMESIRKMAEARAVDDEPAHREDRKRKVGAKG